MQASENEVVQRAARRIVATSNAWQQSWTVVIELSTHVVSRAFGFQIVNASQEASQKGQCTPATSAVAADHLVQLLKDRAAVIATEGPGKSSANGQDVILKESIASLHAALFDQGPYKAWQSKSQVKSLDKLLSINRAPSQSGPNKRGGSSSTTSSTAVGVYDQPQWVLQLAELSLFFCTWTEAANMRHTPELLWLLYHIMLSSNNFHDACILLSSRSSSHYALERWINPYAAATTLDAAAPHDSSTTFSSAAAAVAPSQLWPMDPDLELMVDDDEECYDRALQHGFVRGVLLPVRNALGNAARLGGLLEDGPGPYSRHTQVPAADSAVKGQQPLPLQQTMSGTIAARQRWWKTSLNDSLADRQRDGLRMIRRQPGVTLGSGGTGAAWSLAQLVLEDIAYFGDGCLFLDAVVQPVFNFMAEQIGLMGDKGEQPALRLGYDDINESACIAEVLEALAHELLDNSSTDPWSCLLNRYVQCHDLAQKSLQKEGFVEKAFRPATGAMLCRYTRDYKRLDTLAAMLRDAGAGGVAAQPALLNEYWMQLNAAQRQQLLQQLLDQQLFQQQMPSRERDELLQLLRQQQGRKQQQQMPLTEPQKQLLLRKLKQYQQRQQGLGLQALSPSLEAPSTGLAAEQLREGFVPEWVAPSTGGSMPVVNLLASLLVTDGLWAKLLKKSFVETRSMGAVAVAFSRVYILHALLLCWMTLLAYRVPDMTLGAIFTRGFWQKNYMAVAENISWGLFIHALLHVVKNLMLMLLLTTPKAVRYQVQPPEGRRQSPKSKHTFWQAFSRWWLEQRLSRPTAGAERRLISPPVHRVAMLWVLNLLSLLFWLGCTYVLLDSHFESFAITKNVILTSKITLFRKPDPTKPPRFPPWALVGAAYLAVWALHAVLQVFADRLPKSVSAVLSRLTRKDNNRAAEHFFPFGNLSNSQGRQRAIVNTFLWLIVLTIKILFDFFLVLQRLAQGPVKDLIETAIKAESGRTWFEVGLTVAAMWAVAALLVFFDTGLFWQLVSAVYSTLVLGMHKHVGHVKTWYDLVWAFPRLNSKFAQRLLPEASSAATRPSIRGNMQSSSVSGLNGDMGKDTDMLKDVAASAGHGVAKDVGTQSAAAGSLLPLTPLPPNPVSEVVFAHAWDIVVDDLRARDLLSNAELAGLKFQHLSWAPGRKRAWLLLPRFVAAGSAVEAETTQGLSSKTQMVVIIRSFNWLVWLLRRLDMLQDNEVQQLLLAASEEDVADAANAADHTLGAGSLAQAVHLKQKQKQLQGPSTAILPREASNSDILEAAQVLIRCKDLMVELKKKAEDVKKPLLPLVTLKPTSGSSSSKKTPKMSPDETAMQQLMQAQELAQYQPDINMQLLLEEALRQVLKLAKPSKGMSAINTEEVVQRPYHPRLARVDPCLDLPHLAQDRQVIQAAAAAAGKVAAAATAAEKEAAGEAKKAADADVEQQVFAERRKKRELMKKVISWLLDMLQLSRGDAAPKSGEVVRALCLFATSLHNPDMPKVQPVALTRSMTTLTPHYGEDVVYALSTAVANADMGTKCKGGGDNCFLFNDQEEPTGTLKYLKIVYQADWAHFRERLFAVKAVQQALQQASKGGRKPTAADIEETSFLPGEPLHTWRGEFLTWASMRGQLLQRTVHGMMYYEKALQQLVVMQLRPQLVAAARQELAGVVLGQPGNLRHFEGLVERTADEAALLLAREKYAYVVSSQVLGEMSLSGNAAQRWLAHGVRKLLAKEYPSLRIAYIDWENLGVPAERSAADQEDDDAAAMAAVLSGAIMAAPRNRSKGGKPNNLLRQYSVLLQWDSQVESVKELYRVRLPVNLETDRGVILGEGKPENQNHAIIFCHSETVQTIDCNQDNFLVEALKLPNLLAEFDQKDGRRINVRGSLANWQGSKHCWGRRPAALDDMQGPALVGFREWIFSEDSGALAEFAAATERSFGTTVQRVMHNPGGCRFHYGHPDVWDKLFTMTNGGVSKATKSLHVSEDVFGGYNVMLRGRDITFVDYVAVGKGRDMGFETILTFEAKIAAGNGEQVISRDVYRLARRMNLPRLLSWYFTGNGFFINTALLMHSMLVNAWLCLLLVLMRDISTSGVDVVKDGLLVLGGVQLLQLGSLGILVYIATVWLDHGIFPTLKNVVKQTVAGSMFFYIFRGQTSAASFNADLAYGGATYLATGRGYKLKATPFVDMFKRYGRTHMWYGTHLLLLLIVAVSLGLKISALLMWGNIVAILALLAAPFWFNPFTFDWQKNKVAAREFFDWMAGNKPVGKQLWRQFNNEQLKKPADDAKLQLGRTSRSIIDTVLLLPSVIIMAIACWGMFNEWWQGFAAVSVFTVVMALFWACWSMATRLESRRRAMIFARLVKFAISIVLIVGVLLLFIFMVEPNARAKIDLWKISVRMFIVEFELVQLVCRLLITFLPHWQPARRLVNTFCWVADMAVGLLLLLLLFVGSLFGLLTRYQAAVLFSMGYAAAYLAEEGLKHSELGRLAKELQELQRQERAAERDAARAATNTPQPTTDQNPDGPQGGPGGPGGPGSGPGGGGPGSRPPRGPDPDSGADGPAPSILKSTSSRKGLAYRVSFEDPDQQQQLLLREAAGSSSARPPVSGRRLGDAATEGQQGKVLATSSNLLDRWGVVQAFEPLKGVFSRTDSVWSVDREIDEDDADADVMQDAGRPAAAEAASLAVSDAPAGVAGAAPGLAAGTNVPAAGTGASTPADGSSSATHLQ